MTDCRNETDFGGAEDRSRNEHGCGGGSMSPRRPMMPRRGTIWIPSSEIVPGEPLTLPSQDLDLDRTMA